MSEKFFDTTILRTFHTKIPESSIILALFINSREELEREKNDILVGAFDDDVILACCLLTKLDEETVRLRQMAVKKSQQGKGIGHSMMLFAETLARDKGFKKLIMHARDTAIGFYEKQGYKTRGQQFIEVSIPHHLMEKVLV